MSAMSTRRSAAWRAAAASVMRKAPPRGDRGKESGAAANRRQFDGKRFGCRKYKNEDAEDVSFDEHESIQVEERVAQGGEFRLAGLGGRWVPAAVIAQKHSALFQFARCWRAAQRQLESAS